MKTFQYIQNNSFGVLDLDSDRVANRVFIEAPDAKTANRIAEEHTDIYFYFKDGKDCQCCGNRWENLEVIPETLSMLRERYRDGFKGGPFYQNVLLVSHEGKLEKYNSDYYIRQKNGDVQEGVTIF